MVLVGAWVLGGDDQRPLPTEPVLSASLKRLIDAGLFSVLPEQPTFADTSVGIRSAEAIAWTHYAVAACVLEPVTQKPLVRHRVMELVLRRCGVSAAEIVQVKYAGKAWRFAAQIVADDYRRDCADGS